MIFTGCCFEILLILRYIKKKHNGDLEDGYNVIISAKRNMYGNIYTLLTIVKQYVYI